MVTACDKHREKYHIFKVDKRPDGEAAGLGLGSILHEELTTFGKEDFEMHLEYLKDPKSMAKNSAYMEHRNSVRCSAIFDQNDSHTSKKSFLGGSQTNFSVTIAKAYGVMGFVKFLKGFYLIMITQKKKVAKIGYHSIYQIKDIKMLPCFKWTTKQNQEHELHYVELFKQIKINEGFYFSYTYDLTHTLQNNVLSSIRKKEQKDGGQCSEGPSLDTSEEQVAGEAAGDPLGSEGEESDDALSARLNQASSQDVQTVGNTRNQIEMVKKHMLKHGLAERILREHQPFESHFLWNHYLVKDFYKILIKKAWVMPIIYGDVNKLNFQNDTKNCTFVLISRRSRRYAGTRYLKRGINENGNVANFVEVE